MNTDSVSESVCRGVVRGVFLVILSWSSLSAGQVTFDFETDPTSSMALVDTTNPNGIWSSVAALPDTGNPGNYLTLTEAVRSSEAAVVFADADAGAHVKTFTFRADVRTGNGNVTGLPADGFSVSFARAGDPVLTDGSSFTSNFKEAGSMTGVAVGFDTWSGNTLPDSEDIVGIIVRVDNRTILRHPMPVRDGECGDPRSLQTGPQGSDETAFPRGDPRLLCWQPLEITLASRGLLSVSYKGNALVQDLPTGFLGSPGQFVLAGRTGDADEIKHFDNIAITTEIPGNDAFVSDLRPDFDRVNVQLTDGTGEVIDPATVALFLDGTAVAVATSKNGGVTSVEHVLTGFFSSGSRHDIRVVANGGLIDETIAFQLQTWTTVGPEYRVSGNFTERGFLMRVVQSTLGIGQNIEDRETHLAGQTIINGLGVANRVNETGGRGGVFEVTPFINLDEQAMADGEFFQRDAMSALAGTARDRADVLVPGIPGQDGGGDSFTTEILCLLEVTNPGLHYFGFNSDDGFQMAVGGVNASLRPIVLGEFGQGRGSASSLFRALFSEAGLYPIRTIWFEGFGDSAAEWWVGDPIGLPRALVNDDAHGGLKAFREFPVEIPDANLTSAVRTALSQPTGLITVWDLAGLTTLDASGAAIADLRGLERAINLTSLNLSGTSLTSLRIPATLAKLTSLDLSANQLTQFAISPYLGRTLVDMDLTGNPLTVVYVAPGVDLTNVTLTGVDPSLLMTAVEVQGSVKYYSDGTPMDGVQVAFEGDHVLDLTSASDGTFLTYFSTSSQNTVALDRSDDTRPDRGVTTLDLMAIQSHLLGVEPFTDVYRYIAGDVNRSSRVDLIDLILMRDVILGSAPRYVAGQSLFRFAQDTLAGTPVPANPSELRTFWTSTNPIETIGRFGMKLGDVDGDWSTASATTTTAAQRRSVGRSVTLGLESSSEVSGDSRESVVSVTAGDFRAVTSLQFSLRWDPDEWEFGGIVSTDLSQLAPADFGLTRAAIGEMGVAWIDPTLRGVDYLAGDPLFSFRLRSKRQQVLPRVEWGSVPTQMLASQNRQRVDLLIEPGDSGNGFHPEIGIRWVEGTAGAGRAVLISLPGAEGWLYELEFTDRLAPAKWQLLESRVGRDEELEFQDSRLSGATRFYRVRQRRFQETTSGAMAR